MFKEVSIRFIKKQIELYGTTSHLYNGDLFMEMLPKSWEPEYLASCSRGLVESLKAGDPDAIWFMEGWTFRWESSWTPDRIKAFLDGVDKEDMVVFDMNSEYVRDESDRNYEHEYERDLLLTCSFPSTRRLEPAISA